MKIQFGPRAVVIGVVAVISVVAIVALAQRPTPTCTPDLTEKLQFHLVMKCVSTTKYPNLVQTIKNDVSPSHRYYQEDNKPIDGTLPVPAQEKVCCDSTRTNSNVTQRLAFIKKEDLDAFMSAAFSSPSPTPTPTP